MKLLLKGKQPCPGLSSCTCVSGQGSGRSPPGGTDKIHPSKGTRTDGSTEQREESIPMSYNSSTSAPKKSEGKCTWKRLLCFFIPQYPSLLHSTSQPQSWNLPSTVHTLHHLTTTGICVPAGLRLLRSTEEAEKGHHELRPQICSMW